MKLDRNERNMTIHVKVELLIVIASCIFWNLTMLMTNTV